MSDSVNPWAVAQQASLPIGFSRQEYWSGLPFPSPGDLPDLEIETRSPTLQTDSLLSELPGKTLFTIKLYDEIINTNLVFLNTKQ